MYDRLSDVPATVDSARCAAAYVALARLDALVAGLDACEARLFALRLVRHSLIAALGAAGYPDAAMRFDDWAGLTGAPPSPSLNTVLSVSDVVRTIVALLRANDWPPLTAALDLVHSAAPHLQRAADPHAPAADLDAEGTLLAMAAAGGTLAAECERGAAPLTAMLTALAGDAFAGLAPGDPEPLILEHRGERRALRRAAEPSRAWLLGACIGGWLAATGVMRRPLPLFGGVPAGALRGDLDTVERRDLLADTLAATAVSLTAELLWAQRVTEVGELRFSNHRVTSRAAEALAAIAGFGTLRRRQLATGLGMTLPGADLVVAKLRAAKLIERRTGGAYALAAARTRSSPSVNSPPPPSATQHDAIDALLDDTDALLARLAKRDAR